MKQVWDRNTGEITLVEDDVPTIAEVVGNETRRYLDDRPQEQKDALAAATAAALAEMQVDMDRLSSWEIRDALTREERKSIRSSTNDDVVEAYEDVLTMGDYKIRRDDPRLSGFLTLIRAVHPEHTYNGLAELIGAELV